jgi:hypothetical protein
MNRLLAAFQHVQWYHIADGKVESLRIVVFHKAAHRPLCVLDCQWRRRTDALALDRPVIAFDLAIALRIEWACADVRHPGNLHEVPEVIRDELRTFDRDDPRTRPRAPLTSLLRQDLDLPFSHLRRDVHGKNQPREVIDGGRHEYERAGDVDGSNIDVPVLMRGEWLNEPSPLRDSLPRGRSTSA